MQREAGRAHYLSSSTVFPLEITANREGAERSDSLPSSEREMVQSPPRWGLTLMVSNGPRRGRAREYEKEGGRRHQPLGQTVRRDSVANGETVCLPDRSQEWEMTD